MLSQIGERLGVGRVTTRDPVAYNEFYRDNFEPRGHYLPLWDHIREAGQNLLREKSHDAHLALRNDGVTFRVYSDRKEGVERVWPFDLLPRIIPAREWRTIEAGLKQRVSALNLFLADIYHSQRIIKDGVIPAELIYRSRDFRLPLMDCNPPGDVYVHIAGVDLIRDELGRYVVLEDNLRTPSGVSYLIENRMVTRQTLPEFFSRYRVRRIEHYPALLMEAMRHVSPRGPDTALVVVLTPGIHNSAYFEHTFLAKEMGVELAEGQDLVVKNHIVYLKTTHGLRRVDVVYRRVDDDFLDPVCGNPESVLGVAGIINAWRAGNVAIVNGPGTGVADDKAVYPYVPDMIRYYLGEVPILQNVHTYQLTSPEDQEYVLDNLPKLVVKPVSESGGYGLFIGPASTASERKKVAEAIRKDPRNYIAQPVVQLSTHLCYLNGELESRHVDLRPFVVAGKDVQVIPGGLTRVALKKGSLVVNSSQGGGSKDTWVLAE